MSELNIKGIKGKLIQIQAQPISSIEYFRSDRSMIVRYGESQWLPIGSFFARFEKMPLMMKR
jgi:hypothetical protein